MKHKFNQSQLVNLTRDKYADRFVGPDRYFRSIGQIVGDREFVCDAEALAQSQSAKKNPVFRSFQIFFF
jgi:hypothetical protein